MIWLLVISCWVTIIVVTVATLMRADLAVQIRADRDRIAQLVMGNFPPEMTSRELRALLQHSHEETTRVEIPWNFYSGPDQPLQYGQEDTRGMDLDVRRRFEAQAQRDASTRATLETIACAPRPMTPEQIEALDRTLNL